MNNGLTTERAMLGVFSTTSYNTIGDAYGKKPKPDPRHTGKQLTLEPPHMGTMGATPLNALFDREFKSLHKGDKYEDRTMYYKTQPRDTRKTGFLSSDAFKSDEFTQHFPTEQWRERIKSEMMHVTRTRETLERKAAEMSEEEKAAEAALLKTLKEEGKPWTHGPDFLFDVGKPSLGGETPYSMYDARDTWYSKSRQPLLSNRVGETKRMGPYRTYNQVYGQGSENVHLTKPAFARTPFIKDNFYRASGIPFNTRAPTV
mmetsp:Transcript_18177/g.46893  ORF Transcript_18177/g.46893 Transcript_18177/m.46893 type:complete len:259 (+) Transcript_18177:131-907(+)